MGGELTGSETVMWIVRITFVIIISLLFLFAVNSNNNRKIDINIIEGETILNRIFYSDNCFAYSDTRPYPGIIDLKKFNDDVLKKCLKGDYLLKAELKNAGMAVYNDKNKYEQNIGFCKYTNKFYCYEKEIYVIVNDNGKLKEDILSASFVLPMWTGELND